MLSKVAELLDKFDSNEKFLYSLPELATPPGSLVSEKTLDGIVRHRTVGLSGNVSCGKANLTKTDHRNTGGQCDLTELF